MTWPNQPPAAGKLGNWVFNIKGLLDSSAELPNYGDPGDAYSVGPENVLWLWGASEQAWKEIGALTGVEGDPGPSAYQLAVSQGFTGTLAQWLTSLIGSPGSPGLDGSPGSVWRSGSGAPSDALGANGDFYLDGNSGDAYWKQADAYSQVANLKGPGGSGSGTVTSVGMSVPVGLSIAGSPITGVGTFNITYQSGYSIPTQAKQGNWDTAYGWGNHASAGYLTAVPALAVSNFSAAAIVTETEGIFGNDNDTTLPTSAAVKDYVDTHSGGSSGVLVADLTLATNEVSTSTVLASITDSNGNWTVALEAGAVYEVSIFGSYQTAATTTGFRLGTSRSTNSGIYTTGDLLWEDGSGTVNRGALPPPGTPTNTPSVTVANTAYPLLAYATVYCTTAGNLSISWGSAVTNSPATLRAGSRLLVKKIAP